MYYTVYRSTHIYNIHRSHARTQPHPHKYTDALRSMYVYHTYIDPENDVETFIFLTYLEDRLLAREVRRRSLG